MFKLNHLLRIRNYSSYNRISDVLATKSSKLNEEVTVKVEFRQKFHMNCFKICLNFRDGSKLLEE